MDEAVKLKPVEAPCTTVRDNLIRGDYSLRMKIAFWVNESLKVDSADTVLFEFYEKSQKVYRALLESASQPNTPENVASHEKWEKILENLLTLEPMVREHWKRSAEGKPLPKM